jgi:hypothetical protein
MKRILFLIVAIVGIVLNANAGKNGTAKVLYEPDGHYWSVRLMACLVLKDTSMARQLAYFAEWPDDIRDAQGNHVKNRNTWLLPWRQASWHALTGCSARKARNTSMRRFKKATTTKKKGIMLHRLGDSFAHAMKRDKCMFPYGIGHALRGHTPDKISNFPAKYLVYIDSLCITLGGTPSAVDHSAFKYVAEGKHNTGTNMEILKSELYIHSRITDYFIDPNTIDAVTAFLTTRKDAMGFTFTVEKAPVYELEDVKNGKKGDRKSSVARFIGRVKLTFNS